MKLNKIKDGLEKCIRCSGFLALVKNECLVCEYDMVLVCKDCETIYFSKE